jgi:hypothetical protein
MKKLMLTTVFALLLFSCKGNGQTTNTITNDDNSEEVASTKENHAMFSGDYDDLLTIEMAAKISGFEPSEARKTHILKGMTGEILRYNWENGRERNKETITPGMKITTISCTDLVQIKWMDTEADMESFLDFIEPEEHPELSKITGVGESAYWNSKKNYLEVYANGVSFTVQVDISNDETIDKEKTIALAKLIIEEGINK